MSIAEFRERVQGRDLTSEQSVDLYCSWIRRFHEWFDGDTITEAALRDFDTALENPSTLPWTDREEPYAYSTRVQALSAVEKWAEVMEDATIRPDINDLVRADRSDFDPTILTRGEVRDLLDEECDKTGCLAMRNLGYEAIMRGAEVVDVHLEDFNYDEGTIYVRGKKGSENRHIGVSADTLTLLFEQQSRVQSRFDNPTRMFFIAGRSTWRPNTWTQHFKRTHHEAGFHSFARHTPIVHRLEEGEDFWDVFLRARHTHPSMTARYASIAGRTIPDTRPLTAE